MSLRVVGMCGFVGVLLCCCCDLTAWCSSPPSRCLFWIPSALFWDAGIRRLWLYGLAVSSFPRFHGGCRGRSWVSLPAHGGSTTFPWVASRTVLLVYDLSGLLWPGCLSISADGELFGCVGGFVCPDHFCAFDCLCVALWFEWFEWEPCGWLLFADDGLSLSGFAPCGELRVVDS